MAGGSTSVERGDIWDLRGESQGRPDGLGLVDEVDLFDNEKPRK